MAAAAKKPDVIKEASYQPSSLTQTAINSGVITGEKIDDTIITTATESAVGFEVASPTETVEIKQLNISVSAGGFLMNSGNRTLIQSSLL